LRVEAEGDGGSKGGRAPPPRARQLTSDAVSSPGWAPRLVRPLPVTLPSTDGKFVLHGQLFVPPNASGAGVVYSQ
jgi:hypothetical protein